MLSLHCTVVSIFICKFQQLQNQKGKVFYCEIFFTELLEVCVPPLFTSFGPGHLHKEQWQSVLKISLVRTRNFLVMAPKK